MTDQPARPLEAIDTQSDDPWERQMRLLVSMLLGYAPGIARHDLRLACRMSLTGLLLGNLLDRLSQPPT